ncbi:MAG: ABC transporter ATP-binding protein [Hyphomicrobiaceae bacterium]|nr:ABC transporter ATP-binding protein [Hyphomicrobiaceae bacterium]
MLDKRSSESAPDAVTNAATGTLRVRVRQDAPVSLDAELTCGRHELLSLIGPSGSGKTTLLQIIAGLRPCRSGEIRVGDETWLSTEDGVLKSPQHRGVGFVFQDYALFPHLTALGNVAIAIGSAAAKADANDAAARLLARVHLQGFENRRPHQLSGGEKQRVAIARALARSPRVLLLDEPFSAVDRMTRVSLRADLLSLKASLSIPIVFVTHDIDEAMQLADRVAILDHGRILQTGSPDEVRAHPASPRVAAILGL